MGEVKEASLQNTTNNIRLNDPLVWLLKKKKENALAFKKMCRRLEAPILSFAEVFIEASD